MPPNLLGNDHEHRFEVPWRGVLMCADDWCGEVRHADGAELGDVDRQVLADALRRDYVNGVTDA
jgi:hypothetical protein